MSRWKLVFSLVVVGLAAASGTLWSSDVSEFDLVQIRTLEPSLEILAVPPRIVNYGHVDTTVIKQATSGLHVVGVGEQVFLAANPGISTYGGAVLDVSATTWSLSGPDGSSAALSQAPDIDGREIQMLTPDVVGDYEVSLTMTHADGDTTITRTVVAAKYVGVDACFGCHTGMNPGLKESWEATGHAQILERALDGTLSGHYGASCIKCHSLSANAANPATQLPVADNDGWEDVANAEGWTLPDHLNTGTWSHSDDPQAPDAVTVGGYTLDLTDTAWDALPASLKKLAGIQCESCHGPGSTHATTANAAKIGKSLDNGVCARCHDDGHYHQRPEEWLSSGHATVWSRGPDYAGGSCAPCHTGSGYIQLVIKGEDAIPAGELETGPTQTCAVCHDPHAVANEHQVRVVGEVTVDVMASGSADQVRNVTGDFGTAGQCAQCHNMRPGRNVVNASLHHSHQSEMLLGVGGFEYTDWTYASGSHQHIQNTCAACHMSSPPSGGEKRLGGHSWNMHFVTADGVDIYNTTGCESCHGPIQDFNVNGAQAEIEELLLTLYDLVQSEYDAETGEWEVYTTDAGGHGSAPEPMTDAERKAAWNTAFVSYDGSKGAHNYVYSKALLASTLADLGGAQPAPSAGDFNADGQVNFTDIFMFVAKFGSSAAGEDWEAEYDLNGNGAVGFADWLMLLDLFGSSSAAAKALPVVQNGLNTGAWLSVVGSNHPSIDSDHIAVTVRADNLTELRGYGAVVTYDTETLEFVRAIRATDGLIQTVKGGPALGVIANEPGTVTLSDAVVGDQAVTGSGGLVDLVFRRLGSVTAQSVQIDFAQLSDLSYGINVPSGVEVPQAAPMYSNELAQNFPNPFNPATTIRYSLAQPGDVRVVVYNTLGQEVRTLVDHYRLAGEYSVKWDGRDSSGREVASGTYVYRMTANDFSASSRMVLLK